MLPVEKERNGVDREEVDRQIEYELTAPQRIYGDDYVEYDESSFSKGEDINAELDLMLLEMDDENDNPFGEEIESEDDELEDDEIFEEADEDKDFYEFDDVDPEIFRDPTLMVKWLKKTND